ncbi:tyrosine protein phosphatase 1 [Exophiala xenobiotica]|nr:tyrosine protein phosphatase 1 [Exophiala xenobiotica]
MPQSLTIGTPPSFSIKRQRSQELPINVSRPPTSGQASANGSTVGSDGSARQPSVKVPAYLDKDRAKISAAFVDIGWKERYRLQDGFQNPESSPFRIDRSQTVISRNRYGNVQPWDSSRVKLKKPIGGSDYVNASPIKLTGRSVKERLHSGTSTPRADDRSSQAETHENFYRYIATQGPKEGQFSHFWHMVLQETPGETGVIVMLTQLYEGTKEKCAQYFPLNMENPTIVLPAHEDGNEDVVGGTADDGDPFLDSPTMSADTDSVGTDPESVDSEPEKENAYPESHCGTVTLLSLTYEARIGCEVRKLSLTIENESKVIYHYLYNGWPDFGKPEAEDRKALMELTKVSKTVAGDSPRIVHCSAGVGRTGTWIALDFLLQELESGRLVETSSDYVTAKPRTPGSNGTWGRSGPPKPTTPEFKEEVDLIWETVNSLREQRMMMVMNELQFSFLYEVVKDAFIQKYAEKETGPVVVDVQEPSPKVARKKSPFGGMFEGTKVGSVTGTEETVSESESHSEAETEIMEKDRSGMAVDVEGAAGTDGEVEDPYASVAPETIRDGQRKEEQNEVRDHEAQ